MYKKEKIQSCVEVLCSTIDLFCQKYIELHQRYYVYGFLFEFKCFKELSQAGICKINNFKLSYKIIGTISITIWIK